MCRLDVLCSVAEALKPAGMALGATGTFDIDSSTQHWDGLFTVSMTGGHMLLFSLGTIGKKGSMWTYLIHT